ncbi:MAG: sulfotransferase [Nitrospirota bacterium]|nr:sulfotransferase [Nitrospirota bacterium]
MVSKGEIALLIQQGADFQARHDFAAAADCYRRALESVPDHPQALWLLGMLELGLGNVDSSARCMERLLQTQSRSAQAHYGMGQVRVAQGRQADAESCYRHAIGIDSGYVPALIGLGLLLEGKGDADESEHLLRRAVAADPRVAEARMYLGKLLYRNGRVNDALMELKAASSLAPNNPAVVRLLADVQVDQLQWDEALLAAGHLVRLEPSDATSHVVLGMAYLGAQRVEEAIVSLERALELAPNHPPALIALCDALYLNGEFERGYELIRLLLDSPGVSPGVLTAYAAIAEGVGKTDDALSRIEQSLAGENLDARARQGLCFSAGELLDRRGDYDRAFEMYHEGNRSSAGTFNPEEFSRQVDRQIQVFGHAGLKRLARAHNRISRPVLIVGMPRSGTSLVEQILSSHPRVHGAGELMHIQRIATFRTPTCSPSGQAYPECLRDMTHEELDHLARDYDMDLARMGENALRVTDKNPLNFMHLGLVHQMLPHVRVIHCRRNPVDTCVSNYFQSFASSALAYSNDLSHLGFYYRQYERLMAHWREVLDLRMLEVDYEELVADQERVSRALVTFAGLEWDDACLQFHKTRRTVSTASAKQVRKPIYKGSVERWRRYEKHLGPLLEALGIQP